MNAHVLKNLKIGNIIKFPQDKHDYVVRHIGNRYAFACDDAGCVYTIVDIKNEILAFTTMIFEKFTNFTVEGNAEKLFKDKGEITWKQN